MKHPAHYNDDLGQPVAGDVYVFPATVGQQGFWYLEQVEQGNPAYNIAVRFQLDGPLVVEALERAMNQVIVRHESLRTVFREVDGQPVQVVLPELSITLPVVDLRGVPTEERPSRSEALTVEEARRPFDLTSGPLVRVRLLQLADQQHVLLLTVHHIISDGWSIGVISDELGSLYETFCQRLPSALPELPLQYADFAVWQREWLAHQSLAGELGYWTSRLKNLPQLEVPTDRPRPKIQTSNGHIESVLLPTSLTDALQALAQREGATLFMVALAALKVLLQRRTQHDDVIVGSLVAGRSRVELERLVGLFINPIVLRTDLSSEPTFVDLLTRVRSTVLEAIAHQEVPFERVVEAVQPKRDRSRHPLFQINFIFQRDFVRPLTVGELRLTALPSRSPGAIYDLNFFMVERADGWRASCEYNTDLYDAATVNLLLAQFHSLLESVAADPSRPIDRLPMLSSVEYEFRQATIDRPRRAADHALRNGAASSAHVVAPRDEVEAKLAELWRQVLNVSEISADSDFFDAGGHSLLAARLLAHIERTFGQKISVAAFLHAPTIQGLAARLRIDTASARRELVHAIQPSGSRVPFFVLTSQTPEFYRPLAQRLGADQPMLGLSWPELSQLPGGFTIHDLVANLMDALHSVQPTGPYYLGGWCMSGVVICELARQLRARGEQVAAVVLFDANTPTYVHSFEGLRRLPVRLYFHIQRWQYRLAKLWNMGPRAAFGHLRKLLHNTSSRAGNTTMGEVASSIELQSRVAGDYDPQPYDGTVVLFRSAIMQRGRFRDPTMGWGDVCHGGLDVYEISGEHHHMFVEPYVGLLAEKLKTYLAQPGN